MVRIQVEAFGLLCPAFADVFVRREAGQGLHSTAIIVGVEVHMAVVVMVVDHGFFDGPAHSPDPRLRRGRLCWQPRAEFVPLRALALIAQYYTIKC
jgi:hypothetical protein